MKIEDAIKLAIEKGGYQLSDFGKERVAKDIAQAEFWVKYWSEKQRHSGILLDPEFWKSLGKALGWYTGHENISLAEYETKNWKSIALRFFELKLSGGSEEEFWDNLLSN